MEESIKKVDLYGSTVEKSFPQISLKFFFGNFFKFSKFSPSSALDQCVDVRSESGPSDDARDWAPLQKQAGNLQGDGQKMDCKVRDVSDSGTTTTTKSGWKFFLSEICGQIFKSFKIKIKFRFKNAKNSLKK